MLSHHFLYLSMGIFLVANLLIGLYAGRRVDTLRDYVVANRSLGSGVLALTFIATFVDGRLFSTIYELSKGKAGITDLIRPLAYAVWPMIFAAFIIPNLVYFEDCLTIGDVMKKIYGKHVSLFSSLLGLLASIAFVGAQFTVLGKFFSLLLKIDSSRSILIVALFLLLYTSFGGMRAVAFTDVVQFVAILIGFGVLLHSLISRAGGFEHFIGSLIEHPTQFFAKYRGSNPLSRTISFICVVAFPTFWMMPPLTQRMLSAGDKEEVKKMFFAQAAIYAAVRMALVLISCALISISYFPPRNMSKVDFFPSLLLDTSLISSGLSMFVILAFIAIVMSTADSFLHSASILGVRNIVQPLLKVPLDEENELQAIRGMNLFVVVISALLGYLDLKNIYLFSTTALLLLSSLNTPFIAGVAGMKSNVRTFVISAVVANLFFPLSLAGHYLTHGTWSGLDIYFYIRCSIICANVGGFITFMILHYWEHGGFSFEHRHEHGVHYNIWHPSWTGLFDACKAYCPTPRKLLRVTRSRVATYGMHDFSFALFMAVNHIIPYFMVEDLAPGAESSIRFLVVKSITALLCVGLLLRTYWHKKLERFFPLYWFFTLAFSLPFSYVFLLFKNGLSSIWAFNGLVAIFILLALVSFDSFCVLLFVGGGLGLLVHYLLEGTIMLYAQHYQDYFLLFYALIVGVVVGGLFLQPSRRRMGLRIMRSKLLAGSLGHELGNTAGVMLPTGQLIRDLLKGMKKEGAYYKLSAAHFQALNAQSQILVEAGKRVGSEVPRFISMISNDRIDGKMEHVSLSKLLKEGYSYLAVEAQPKVCIDVQKDFEVCVPAKLFHHVIYNLVQNALHHGLAKKVTLKADVETRSLIILDDGMGIGNADLDELFKPFYTAGEHGGFGIGLGLVKMILDAAGATITCDSKEGKGSYTQFIVTFP